MLASPASRSPSPWVLCCCAAFVAVNLVVPLTLGDVYPFTIAPMFRDAPREYCNYRVYAPDGTLLADNSTRRIDPPEALDPFCLRRYYDGNPPGLGVGVSPPATLCGGAFGDVPSQEQVRAHICDCLKQRTEPYVEVEQEIVGPLDAWRVGIVRTERWRISREGP